MSRFTTVFAFAVALILTAGVGTAGAHKKQIFTKTTLDFQALPGSTGDRISGVVSFGLPPQEPVGPDPPGVEPLALGPLASAAARGNCVRGTTVEITQFLTSEGGGQASTPTVVATATSDATGAWQTSVYEAAGANQLKFDTFKAKVVKKRLPPKNKRHKHVCFGAGANKTTFSPSPDP